MSVWHVLGGGVWGELSGGVCGGACGELHRVLPCCCCPQDKLGEAEVAYRHALAVMEGALGDGHAAVSSCVSNIISVLRMQGKEKESLKLYTLYNTR